MRVKAYLVRPFLNEVFGYEVSDELRVDVRFEDRIHETEPGFVVYVEGTAVLSVYIKDFEFNIKAFNIEFSEDVSEFIVLTNGKAYQFYMKNSSAPLLEFDLELDFRIGKNVEVMLLDLNRFSEGSIKLIDLMEWEEDKIKENVGLVLKKLFENPTESFLDSIEKELGLSRDLKGIKGQVREQIISMVGDIQESKKEVSVLNSDFRLKGRGDYTNDLIFVERLAEALKLPKGVMLNSAPNFNYLTIYRKGPKTDWFCRVHRKEHTVTVYDYDYVNKERVVLKRAKKFK